MFVIFRSDNYEYFVITILCHVLSFYFFFNDTATTEIYTLSLHDALPICPEAAQPRRPGQDLLRAGGARPLPRGTRRAGRRGRGGGGRPGGRRARPRQRWRGAPRRARRRHAPARARMTAPRVALMVTCLGDVFFPEVGVSIVRLLRRLGATVEFPPGQTCCGLPLFNSGYHTEARAVAARTVALFRDADNVVVPSGSCAWMVKHEYPGLMQDPALKKDALRLSGRTYELSQFLVKVLGRRGFRATVGGRGTHHDSCHLLRGLHEAESPRA